MLRAASGFVSGVMGSCNNTSMAAKICMQAILWPDANY